MQDLSNRQELLKLDISGALSTIEQLPDQITQAWRETNEISFPADYKEVQNIVVCGMGASWLGAHIMQGLLADRLTIPLIVCHDYHLPAFVNEQSLVITSSYSGTTEETIQCLKEADERKAKIMAISTGGQLSVFAKEKGLPNYTFVGTHNLAKSPRLGLGYSIAAQIAVLAKLGFIRLSGTEIETTIAHLRKRVAELKPEVADNTAQLMAKEIVGYIPIVVGGTFLLGVAHTFSNQFNETAKTFGTFAHIPELNHHLMEGLAHPAEVIKLKFLFLESNLYDPKVQMRFRVTKEVVEQNKITYLTYIPQGNTKLTQAFDVLLFGSFVTYYLAMLHDVDPSPNPYVDYFKNRLKELSK